MTCYSNGSVGFNMHVQLDTCIYNAPNQRCGGEGGILDSLCLSVCLSVCQILCHMLCRLLMKGRCAETCPFAAVTFDLGVMNHEKPCGTCWGKRIGTTLTNLGMWTTPEG